ncbi:MAG: PLP-dependent aspartate aminotransferase family protein [Candidatus Neomarinimicrobiota bacterium]
MNKKDKFQTLAIHIGNKPDKETGAVSPPIHLTSTFEQESVGNDKGFDYSRGGNPTRKRLEDNLAALEQGTYGLMFASGMAATTALFQTLSSGDHVIIGHNVYGGTYRMSTKVLSNHGIDFEFIDTRSTDLIKSAIKQNTKLIFVETPTNPLLELCDIAETSKLCMDQNILLAVDNTFMSPYGQNPLTIGADVVMHSVTKFIGGHSDILAGALVTNDSKLAEKLYFVQKSGGAVPSPFDCWLLLRSTKTMELRVQRQSDNAKEIAKRLQKSGIIDSVIYPGLESHNQHEIAVKQQVAPDGSPIFGSMISIRCGTVERRDRFLSKLRLFTLAESLGGVESLVCVPYEMTHSAVPEDLKESMGLTKDLVRLSIGIEHVDDLYDDIISSLE